MKKTTSLSLTALSVVALLAFSNCKKEQTVAGTYSPTSTRLTTASGFTFTDDRIDAIVKDLSQDSYSLSFEKPNYGAGITRTAYGADNYLAYVDPQDLICPDPIRLKFKRIPIWKRPNFILPTCPDMIIDIIKWKEIREVLAKADPAQFGDLKNLDILGGGAFFATEKFTSQYKTMQLDKIDRLTGDLNQESFLMLNQPGDFTGGFTRNFYGNADLNEIVLRPKRIDLKELFRPILKGCFDPRILSIIRERLQTMDPVAFKGLQVTPVMDDKNIAVLGFN
jgi:hypothetical protein